VGEQAGGEAVGELTEGEVDLGLDLGEGGGVAGELLGPAGLSVGELAVDVAEGLVGGRDVGAVVGVGTDVHGNSFRGKLVLTDYNTIPGPEMHHFLGMDPRPEAIQRFGAAHGSPRAALRQSSTFCLMSSDSAPSVRSMASA